MAGYVTSNPPRKISIGSIDNSQAGPNVWRYDTTTDSDATVKAAGYFSNALELGMALGDIVYVGVTGTGLYIHFVDTATSDAAFRLNQTPAALT